MEAITALGEYVESVLRGVYTAIPARIVSVSDYGDRQVVNVQPTIQRLFEDGDSPKTPIIENVPIVMPSAGGGLLSFPVAVGDGVLVVFSMRDMDTWQAGNGEPSTPPTQRHHKLTDAIAIPGLYPGVTHLQPSPVNVELKFAGSSVQLHPNGDAKLLAAKDATVSSGGNMTITADGDINMTATGNVNINAATINLNE